MGTLLPAQYPALPKGCSSPSNLSNFSARSVFLRQARHRPPRPRGAFLVATASATFYDILELPPDVGLSDIKKAYRQLARRYHPDVCPSEESTRRFIEIQEAYETLSDPRRRAVYDHAVAMGRGTAFARGRPWSPSSKDSEPADWKFQWESQLTEFKRRSAMRARTDSWAARMRMQNELQEI